MTYWIELDSDGSVGYHEYKGTLADYQGVVGGYIEAIYPDHDEFCMYANEEALFDDPTCEPNPKASTLIGQPILGNVCIVGKVDRFGNTMKLTAKAISIVEGVL